MSSVAMIAGSFALWAVVHSILASSWMKALVRRAFGPGTARWYRLFFVSFAVLTLTPILLAVAVLPDRALYAVGAPWRWVMMVGQAGAVVALVISVAQAGVMHFLGLAQVLAGDPSRTGTLQVNGVYRYVRHPLYLFGVILVGLTPSMSLNRAAAYACMTLYFIIGSIHEEALLEAEFGESYARYRVQVPRFFPLPGRQYEG